MELHDKKWLSVMSLGQSHNVSESQLAVQSAKINIHSIYIICLFVLKMLQYVVSHGQVFQGLLACCLKKSKYHSLIHS